MIPTPLDAKCPMFSREFIMDFSYLNKVEEL